MRPKYIFFTLAALACFTTAQAQVKVGANPGTLSTNAVLDVEGTSGAHAVILQNGNMGVGTTTPGTKLEVNSGTTAGAIKLVDGTQGAGKVLTSDANGVGTWQATGSTVAYKVVATQPVEVTGSTNNLDLGLSQAVTVPAGRNAIISVHYNVPMGLNQAVYLAQLPNSYIGVRFVRNGIEAEEGSRKFTLAPYGNQNTLIVSMGHTAGQYLETIVAAGTSQTITYEAQGFVYQSSTGDGYTPTYRFNMWDASGDNFNWGKASMIVTVTYY